jgi:hypothetical protein
MATLGQQLKAAREAKGVSESEAGKATKILTKLIVDMEADDFSEMAAPTYAKGFIRLYARYLGLDPQPMVDEYLEKHAPGPRKPQTEKESRSEPGRKKPETSGINLKKNPLRPDLRKWLAPPVRLLSGLRKHLSIPPSPESPGRKKDPRIVAGIAAGLIVLLVLIFSISTCVRRNRPEPAPRPEPAAARQLLDEPLPDLYLYEPGKIEQDK